jgi:virulence-associated protein VagC
MDDGYWDGDVGDDGPRPAIRWWVLVIVVVGSGVLAWRTTSIGTALELMAVLGVLLGVGIAFGAAERRPRRGSSLLPPGRGEPDGRLAARVVQTLTACDRIEHRRLEVGNPWPQLLVGPTGAIVVDLCRVGGRVELDRSGVRDGGEGRGRPCSRCQDALRIAASLRESLRAAAIEFPVRTVAVVDEGTDVVIRPDAPDDVCVVAVDGLADALSRGPVHPMGQVDAAFAQLTRTVGSQRLPAL